MQHFHLIIVVFLLSLFGRLLDRYYMFFFKYMHAVLGDVLVYMFIVHIINRLFKLLVLRNVGTISLQSTTAYTPLFSLYYDFVFYVFYDD